MKKIYDALDKKLFWPIAIFFIIVIGYGLFFQDSFASVCSYLLYGVLDNFTWLILLVIFALGGISVFCIFHPFGKKIIGGPDAKPEFSMWTWVALSLCASIGVAIMFKAVSEPLGFFYSVPPHFVGIEPETNRAALASIADRKSVV